MDEIPDPYDIWVSCIVAARTEFFVDKLPTSTIVEVNRLAEPRFADRVPGNRCTVTTNQGRSA
ncbi:MAG: hypothetical protein ACREKH_08215 [Candidatus Rokuibacteriota bacterium]